MTTEFEKLRLKLLQLRESGETWDTIAKRFHSHRITRAHIYKIVNKGWEPDDPDLRIALELGAYKLAPICPIHGIVHDYDCQSQVVRPKPKPRKPRARIAIRKDDMTSAAHTIVDNIAPGYVNQLIVKLLTLTKNKEM